MRNYTVKYYIDDADMIRGAKPHSEECELLPVEAESAEQAIELAKDYLQEQVIQHSEYTAEIQGNKVVVIDDEEETVECYYSFCCICAIQAARKEIGMSRAEMSRRFEIPARTLQNWETGTRMPAHWAEKLILEKLESLKQSGEANE